MLGRGLRVSLAGEGRCSSSHTHTNTQIFLYIIDRLRYFPVPEPVFPLI